MRQAEKKFSIVNLLFVISLLMIAVGLFGPFIARSRTKAKPSPVATSARPARLAR